MKNIKFIIFITATAVALFFLYAWFIQEEWSSRKRCGDCEALENQQQQRFTGTVGKLQNGKIVFSEQNSGIKYDLIPCDANCDNEVKKWFDKMGFTDENNRKVLFELEGKIDTINKVLIYSSAILLGSENSVMPNQ